MAAERSYRLALRVDPEDLETAVNLGALLVNQNRELSEARALLTHVLDANSRDLHLFAATVLVGAEVLAVPAGSSVITAPMGDLFAVGDVFDVYFEALDANVVVQVLP